MSSVENTPESQVRYVIIRPRTESKQNELIESNLNDQGSNTEQPSPTEVLSQSREEEELSTDSEDQIAPGPDLFDVVKEHSFMQSDTSLYDVIEKSDYLQKYPSWLGYIGADRKNQFAPTFIDRNDRIWELMCTERSYVDMLLMVRDVYMLRFPKIRSIQLDGWPVTLTDDILHEILFPQINELVEAHERLLRPLLALHQQADEHVIKSIGSFLVQLLDDKNQTALAQLYGGFMFAQQRIRELLPVCKNWPPIALFLEKCKQNLRINRRSLDDCHMVIVQRWTKIHTLLEAIMGYTVDSTEMAELKQSSEAVRALLKGAEAVMTARQHTEKLREFAEKLIIPGLNSVDREDACHLHEVMQSPSTTLINYGPLRLLPQPVGHQVSNARSAVEGIGIALDKCFCMVQKNYESGRYQLLRVNSVPPVLWWGQYHGYFRKAIDKGKFGFYIVLSIPVHMLTLYRCNTLDDFARWDRIISEGFAQYRETSSVTWEQLTTELDEAKNSISTRRQCTDAVFELLEELDADIVRTWSARSFLTLTLIEERMRYFKESMEQQENSATDQPESVARSPHLAALSTPLSLEEETFINGSKKPTELDEIYARFHTLLNRLSFSLTESSTVALSRSASDVEERRRPSLKPIRKNETFSCRDSTSIYGDPKTLPELSRKHKKRDTHRISITMANLFRGSNRDKSSSHHLAQLGSPDSALPSSYTATIPSSQYSSSHNRPLSTGGVPSRPVCILTGDSHPVGSTTDDSNSGSIAPVQSESLEILADLLQLSEEFFPSFFHLRTRNEQLEAHLREVETERDKFNDFFNRAKQNGFLRNSVDCVGGGELLSDMTVKQGTEKLRHDVEEFHIKSEIWEKDRQRQRDDLERQHNKLADKWSQYEQEIAELERRQLQYEDNCKTLQTQIDLHGKYGLKCTGVVMPEIKLPEANVSQKSDLRSHSNRSTRSPTRTPVHSYLASDRWADPVQPNREHDGKVDKELTPRPSGRGDDLPVHLRGSLLNQRVLGAKPIVQNASSTDSLTPAAQLSSTVNPNLNTSNSSALWSLADSSKPSGISKKSGRHRFP